MVIARLARLAGLLLLFCLTGCALDQPRLDHTIQFVPPPAEETIYVVPFLAIMVPDGIEQGIFDRLVDLLNADGGHEFVIVKRGREPEGRAWLASRYFLTGEIFGYHRESGCCSTDLRLQTRLYYHQPGNAAPTLVATFPYQAFFDHDRSNLDVETERLIAVSAQNLAQLVAAQLLPPPPAGP